MRNRLGESKMLEDPAYESGWLNVLRVAIDKRNLRSKLNPRSLNLPVEVRRTRTNQVKKYEYRYS